MVSPCYAPHRTFALIDLNEEGNIPTWFSVGLMMLVGSATAAVAAVNHLQRRPLRWGWTLVAAGAFYISLDDFAQLHERAIVLRDRWQLTGIFYFGWVVPALALLPVVLAMLLPFLIRLPRRTRNLLLAGAGVYELGAMGMEMISGDWADRHGMKGLTFAMMTQVEEVLELLGTTVLLYAVMDHARSHLQDVTIAMPPPRPADASHPPE